MVLCIPNTVVAFQVPKPEYYGVYALDSSRLLGVNVSWSNYEPLRRPAVVGNRPLPGFRMVVPTTTNVAQLGPAVRFLFYFENTGLLTPMMAAADAKLHPMAFTRRKSTWNGNQRPPKLERTEAVGRWDARDERIELLMKPVDGEPRMVVVGPAKSLANGVYQLSALDTVFVFSVGPLDAAERERCVDEAATYVLAIWDSKFTPCGKSDAVAADAGTATTQNHPSPGATVREDYASVDRPHPGYAGYQAGIAFDGPGVVVAAATGTVALVVHMDTAGTGGELGNTVILEHRTEGGDTLYTLYGNLSNVREGLTLGATVAKGQALGDMGAGAWGNDRYWIRPNGAGRCLPGHVVTNPAQYAPCTRLLFQVKLRPVLDNPEGGRECHSGYPCQTVTPTHPNRWGYRNPWDLIRGKVQVVPR
jgi:hypothetical protein